MRSIRWKDSRRRLVIPAVIALLLLLSRSAQAQSTETETTLVVLQLLRTDASNASSATEDLFLDELKLAVDDFTIREVTATGGDFASLSMTEKLQRIRSLPAQGEVAATLWLEGTDGPVTALHLVALSDGRALVKVVEADTSPTAPADLALAVRELLVEAALFHVLPPKQESNGPSAQKQTPAAPVEANGFRDFKLFVGAAFHGGSGVYDPVGPSARVGGQLLVEMRPRGGLFLRFQLTADGRPEGESGAASVSGANMDAGVDVGYGFGVGRFTIGPFAGAAGAVSWSTLTAGTGEVTKVHSGSFYGSAGLDLRLYVAHRVFVTATGRMGVLSHNEKIVGSSDGAVALETPRVDWQATLGVCVALR